MQQNNEVRLGKARAFRLITYNINFYLIAFFRWKPARMSLVTNAALKEVRIAGSNFSEKVETIENVII